MYFVNIKLGAIRCEVTGNKLLKNLTRIIWLFSMEPEIRLSQLFRGIIPGSPGCTIGADNLFNGYFLISFEMFLTSALELELRTYMKKMLYT